MVRMMLLLTSLLLVPLNGEWSRVAAQEGNVTLWTGEATWTHKHNAIVQDVRVSWLRTLRLDFTVDSHRILDPNTLKMFHGLNGSWVFKTGTVTVRHEGSPDSDMREVLKDQIDYVGVRTSVKTCSPELSATTEGVPDNTLILQGTVTPRVVWNYPGAGTRYQRLGLVIKIQFPYRYDQTALDPPEADVPQTAGMGGVAFPAGAVGLNPPLTPATMKVTLKRKPLELRYEPLSSDQLKETVSFTDWTGVTDFHAIAATGGDAFVHGNSRIHVLVDSNDASASFIPTRFLTEWKQPIDQSGRPSGRLSGGGWRLDTKIERNIWNDVPGEKLTQRYRSPNRWPQERYMQEYLVGVKGFPEFGALYFIVVVDTRPNGYRVQMFPAKKITIDEFCAIKARTTPYQTETSSGTAVVDSGWQVAR